MHHHLSCVTLIVLNKCLLIQININIQDVQRFSMLISTSEFYKMLHVREGCNLTRIWLLLWISGQYKALTDRLQCSWRSEVKSSISLTGKALTKTLSCSWERERERERQGVQAWSPSVRQAVKHLFNQPPFTRPDQVFCSASILTAWQHSCHLSRTTRPHTHTHTHWCPCFIWIFHKRNDFYTVQTLFSIPLP